MKAKKTRVFGFVCHYYGFHIYKQNTTSGACEASRRGYCKKCDEKKTKITKDML